LARTKARPRVTSGLRVALARGDVGMISGLPLVNS
jgi:hypothetical protein